MTLILFTWTTSVLSFILSPPVSTPFDSSVCNITLWLKSLEARDREVRKSPSGYFKGMGWRLGRQRRRAGERMGCWERRGRRARGYQGRGLRQEKERPERRMEGASFQSAGGEEKAWRREPWGASRDGRRRLRGRTGLAIVPSSPHTE